MDTARSMGLVIDTQTQGGLGADLPVKGTGEDEVVVGRELAQAGLELALVDQPAGLVDNDEGKDGPEKVGQSRIHEFIARLTHMTNESGESGGSRQRGR